MSLAAILFSQVAYLEAIDWTNSATATIMQSLGMVLVLVYVCLRMRRRPRRRELLGVGLALVGTYLVATGGNPGQLNLPPEGLAWGFACAAAAACLAILPAAPMARWGNFAVNGLAFLLSGALLAAAYRPWEHMPVLDGTAVAVLALCVVVGDVWRLCALPAGREGRGLHAREPARHDRARHGDHRLGGVARHALLGRRDRGALSSSS